MPLLNPACETNESPPFSVTSKVPRADSLLHRLQHARDAEGRSVPLLQILLRFLEDPPPGVTDRWKLGAEFCQRHGIAANCMTVWRFYRACLRRGKIEELRKCYARTPSNTCIAAYSAG